MVIYTLSNVNKVQVLRVVTLVLEVMVGSGVFRGRSVSIVLFPLPGRVGIFLIFDP